jgi:GTP-binding protein
MVLGDIATDESDLAMSLFSALKKSGVGDAALVLHQWT